MGTHVTRIYSVEWHRSEVHDWKLTREDDSTIAKPDPTARCTIFHSPPYGGIERGKPALPTNARPEIILITPHFCGNSKLGVVAGVFCRLSLEFSHES